MSAYMFRNLSLLTRLIVTLGYGFGDAHINKMAKKYLGVDKYPYGQPGEVRVIYKIKVEHTTVMG